MSIVSMFDNGRFEIGIGPEESRYLTQELTRSLGSIACPPIKTIITNEGRVISGEVRPDIEDPESLIEIIATDAEVVAALKEGDITVYLSSGVVQLHEISDDF